MVTVKAHFDGEQIQLDEPIELKPNTKLLVTVLEAEEEAPEPDLPFPENVRHLVGRVQGPRDLAVNHDYYLYGRPKQEESEDT